MAVEQADSKAEPMESDDQRWARMEATVAEIPESEIDQLDAFLAEADRQAKEWVRREMGLAK